MTGLFVLKAQISWGVGWFWAGLGGGLSSFVQYCNGGFYFFFFFLSPPLTTFVVSRNEFSYVVLYLGISENCIVSLLLLRIRTFLSGEKIEMSNDNNLLFETDPTPKKRDKCNKGGGGGQFLHGGLDDSPNGGGVPVELLLAPSATSFAPAVAPAVASNRHHQVAMAPLPPPENSIPPSVSPGGSSSSKKKVYVSFFPRCRSWREQTQFNPLLCTNCYEAFFFFFFLEKLS